MKNIFLHIGIVLSALAATVSCGSDETEQDVPVQPDKPDVEEKMQANVLTKAANAVVSTGVDVGMYMQHYVDGPLPQFAIRSGSHSPVPAHFPRTAQNS